MYFVIIIIIIIITEIFAFFNINIFVLYGLRNLIIMIIIIVIVMTAKIADQLHYTLFKQSAKQKQQHKKRDIKIKSNIRLWIYENLPVKKKKVYNLNYYDHCQQIKFMCMHNGITYHGEKTNIEDTKIKE